MNKPDYFCTACMKRPNVRDLLSLSKWIAPMYPEPPRLCPDCVERLRVHEIPYVNVIEGMFFTSPALPVK
jgi:hypothetical protein